MYRYFMTTLLGLTLCGIIRAQNLVINPGFEDGSNRWANFWLQSGSISTERAHAGKNAAKIAHAEVKQSGWTQENISGLEPGAVYRVQVYAYRDAATITAQVWLLTRYVYPNGAPRFRTTTGRSMTAVNAWELLTGELTTNPEGVLTIDLLANGKGNIWFDDVTVTLVKSRKQRMTELQAVVADPAAQKDKRAQAFLDLGQIALWIEDDAQAAVADYQKALELLPADKMTAIIACANLAEIYARRKDYPNLLESYGKLLELDPDGGAANGGAVYIGRNEVIKRVLDTAANLDRDGNFAVALAWYDKLLPFLAAEKSELAKVWQLMAGVYREQGDAASEVAMLQRIANLNNPFVNPGFEDGMAGWINFWAQTGSVSTERAYTGKSAAKITHPQATSASGWEQVINGLQPGALYRVEAWAYRDSADLNVHTWLLSSWGQSGAPLFVSVNGESMRAVNAWERLTQEMQADPRGTITLNLYVGGKGNVWFDDVSMTRVRSRDERKADLQAVTANPTATPGDVVQAWLDLGQIALWSEKDYAAARNDYRKVLELGKNDKTIAITAHANLVEACSRLKEYPVALASCAALLELDPDGALAANGMLYAGRKGVLAATAGIAEQQGDAAGAMTAYNRLLELISKGSPESRKILYKVYDLSRRQKNDNEAKAVLKRIAEEFAAAHPPPAAEPADPIRWRLLSDNLRYIGPKLLTGVTYAWETAPDSPSDVKPGTNEPGRRLLDGDNELLGQDITVGWTGGNNAVVFDFKRPYAIGHVRLNFPALVPESVEVQGTDRLGTAATRTEWTTLGRLEKFRDGWNDLRLPATPRARYLRLFIKAQGGVWFREARFLGFRPGEAGPPPASAVKVIGKGETARLVLAAAGKPCCSVVVDEQAPRKVVVAAWFLRDTLSRMAGCEIPIFDVREKPSGTRLIVGGNTLSGKLGVRVAQTYPQGEGYRIRRIDSDIVLLGNDASGYDGTAMAVMDLLQRLGCGWYAPDPLWEVVPKLATVTVPARLDVAEQPDFNTRIMWLGRIDPERERILRSAWRLGGQDMWIGHVFSSLVPDELRRDHPDWFGPEQPCLTNPEVQRYIVDQFREKLDTSPGQFLFFSISANDTVGFCQCPNCQAAGNVSAASVLFANKIADMLRETHPGRFQLGFIAYWVTATPPKPIVKGRPEVVVMLVDNHELTRPRTAPHWTDWEETGSLNGVYEWWIPACNRPEWQHIPWYPGETALQNLRYWKTRGIRYLEYETGTGEQGDGFPLLRWPLYYLGARGAWNCSLHADDIMREACNNLYGKAAEPMFQFYRTLETAMRGTPYTGSLWGLPLAERVYPPAIEAKATGCLATAAKLAGDAPARARVAVETAMWKAASAYLKERYAAQSGVKTTITGKPRWRDVRLVKTYTAPPFKFEEIGLVQLALDPAHLDRDTRENAIAALKKECAELGANGLLLTDTGETAPRVAGKALLVIEE